jgi:hypothetical protein
LCSKARDAAGNFLKHAVSFFLVAYYSSNPTTSNYVFTIKKHYEVDAAAFFFCHCESAPVDDFVDDFVDDDDAPNDDAPIGDFVDDDASPTDGAPDDDFVLDDDGGGGYFTDDF